MCRHTREELVTPTPVGQLVLGRTLALVPLSLAQLARLARAPRAPQRERRVRLVEQPRAVGIAEHLSSQRPLLHEQRGELPPDGHGDAHMRWHVGGHVAQLRLPRLEPSE